MKINTPKMFIGELKEKKGPWMFPNDVITSKEIQITKAGKIIIKSFLLWSLIFVDALYSMTYIFPINK